jgi:fumarate hydratase subunit beta
LSFALALAHAVGVNSVIWVILAAGKRVRNVYMMEKFGAPEAIWEFEVENLPAIVTIDAHGNSLHKEVFAASQAELAKYV